MQLQLIQIQAHSLAPAPLSCPNLWSPLLQRHARRCGTMTMSKALWLALAVLLLLQLAPVSADDDDDDEQLLERFKAAVRNRGELGGPWTRGDGVCRFPGATCGVKDDGLVSLSLPGVPLDVDFRAVAGTLLRLGGVEAVSLRGANVSGSLADGAAGGGWRCGHRLAELDLSGNAGLRGSVFDAAALAGACGGLRKLNLSDGALVGGGGKGDGAAGFAGLDVLDLSYNKIGDLSWIMASAGAAGVRRLDLAGNNISGPLPAFTNCSRMELLDLSSNVISGAVLPGALSGCTGLVSLNLSRNHLTGAFPPDIAGLPRLSSLSLSFNNFSGSLPDSLGALAELRTLDLSSNALTGVIPASLCRSTGSKLELLYLQNNHLAGGIPRAISNCGSLESLDLSLNHINGSIPTSLGSLRRLRELIMWENQLAGEIPASLAGVRGLQNLILDYNGLTGGIPSELVSCKDLNWLSLAGNRLSGPVPAWLGQLHSLAILQLSNNTFSGPIPPELGDGKSLAWLDLNSNRLNGSIPPELAKQSGKMPVVGGCGLVTGRPCVYLRNDVLSSECHGKGSLIELSGVRADDLNRMASKRLCNFTMYMLSTDVTYSHSNGSMIFLDLSFNQLESEIPKELGDMSYLNIMNLGHNLLSGSIPTQLGSAKKLVVLDLSHNHLEGPIPRSFSMLALSEINLSNNRLNGSVPEQGSLATFPKSQYENNSALCGFPLPPCGQVQFSQRPDHKPPSSSNKNLVKFLLPAVTVTAFGAIAAVCLYISIRGRRKLIKKGGDVKLALNVDQLTDAVSHRLVSYHELVRATDNFSEHHMLGSGRFGRIFKGRLSGGPVVAVKVLDMEFDKAVRSFDAECRVLRMARHRNLIRVISTCSNLDFRALVLQYMPNGNLDTLLHRSDDDDPRRLGFHERLRVMLDVAMAMEYQHQ